MLPRHLLRAGSHSRGARQTVLALGVHVYTSLGVVLACLAALALLEHRITAFLLSLWLAVLVDATDGALARYFRVGEVFPGFNGQRLDDIIDYLTFVFLPCLALIEFRVLPQGIFWIALVPMLASAYGFCREGSKTEQSFLGFPSYWNVAFFYFYILPLPLWVVTALIFFFSLLVFVPVHYIYPTKTRWLRKTTLSLSALYSLLVGVLCVFPDQGWAERAALFSLAYPVYYLALSIVQQYRFRKAKPQGT